MELEVPADVGEIRRARRAVASWATALGLPRAIVDDVVLATYEALANAVDHAYPTGAGAVSVTGQYTECDVLVVVRDEGSWQTPGPADGRGRGLLLIRELTDHLDLIHTTTGTTVRMTWYHTPE